MKNPVSLYLDWLRKSIEPVEATHEITMDILVPKGERVGKALIPCAIYTLSHEVDFNPTLVVKKTEEVKRELPKNKPFIYHPETEEVKLEKGEYVAWEQEERCPECQRKIVIAEVAETRYKSCPEIQIALSDPVKNDLKIPARFGIRFGDVRGAIISAIFNDALIAILLCALLFPASLPKLPPLPQIDISTFISPTLLLGIAFALLGVYMLPRSNYNAYKVWQWYSSVKHTLKPLPKADQRSTSV